MNHLRIIYSFLKIRTYRILTISSIVIIAVGAIFYHFVEGWRWLDSIYFTVVTLSTVGYGDFAPQTDIGKVFTMVYMLGGIGLIFGFINAFYTHRSLHIKDMNKRIDKKRKDRKSEHKVI